MWRIENADNEGAGQAPPQPEPEGGKDDRQIIETLKNIVQVIKMQWGYVVSEADAGNNRQKQQDAEG